MSAELQKALDTAVTRIASLEQELRGRPQQTQQEPQGINPQQLMQALMLDAPGVLRNMGLTPDHIAHVRTQIIADALGDNAPPQMMMAAMQGQQYVAAQQTSAAVADLSRQVNAIVTEQTRKSKRESFNAMAALKDKYPHLSKAISANPDRFLAGLDAHGGTAEEYAAQKEQELAEIVTLLGAAPQGQPAQAAHTSPASVNNAANTGHSMQAGSAPTAGALNATPPPAPQGNTEVWDAAQYQAVKDRILKKVSPQ